MHEENKKLSWVRGQRNDSKCRYRVTTAGVFSQLSEKDLDLMLPVAMLLSETHFTLPFRGSFYI